MEKLYIVNPDNFDGHVESTMNFVDKDKINNTIVDYTDLETFEQYNKRKGGNLIVLTWEEFDKDYYQPYLKSIQGKWEEITEERYYDWLGCVPPKRWRKLPNGIETFFVGECYTANLYNACIKIKRNGETKYYTALRCINISDEEMIKDIDLQFVKSSYK